MSTAKNLASTALNRTSPALKSLLVKALNRIAPHSRHANVALAVLHKSQGQMKLAASAYAAAGARSRTPTAYDLTAIKLLLRNGHTATAISSLLTMAKGKPNDAWLEHLAEAVTLFRRREKPLASLLKATRSLANNPKQRHSAGAIFFFAHEFAEARKLLTGIRWQNHPLRNNFAFRTIVFSQQPGTSTQSDSHISAIELFALFPCSIRDYQEINFKQGINTVDLIRGNGHKRLFAKKLGTKVYIIAEPGADLTPRTDDDVERSYTIYANGDDQVQAARAVGIQTLSIKDLVPDQSPITDALYAHAQRLATYVTKLVTDNMMPRRLSHLISSHRSTFEMLLEDRIARELVDIEWYISAIRAAPEDADILLIAADGHKTVSVLPWLLSQTSADRLFLQAPDVASPQQHAIVRAYREIAVSGRGVSRESAPWSKGQVAPSFDATAESFEHWWHSFDSDIRNQARQDSEALQPNACLMIGNLLDRNYADGNRELATTLQKSRSVQILSTTPTQSEAWHRAEIEDRLSNVSIRSLPVMYRDDIDKLPGYEAGRQLAQLLLATSEIRSLNYQGRSIANTLAPAIWKWARLDLPTSLIEYSYLTAAMATGRYTSLVVTPGRARAARLAAVIARNHDVYSVDVQMINTPGYRKYKTPLTDTVTAIDHVAEDLLVSYFKVPAEKIKTIGSPKLDMFRTEVERCDPDQALRELGLSRQPGPVICFASQLQPIDRCVEIVQVLVDYVAANTPCRLILKLHPREDRARQEAYANVIQAAGVGDRIALITGPDMQNIYRVTNVLVTMYSNAAREALVLGRSVVIANFTNEPWPMRFDLPGLAKGAYSPAELTASIDDACENYLRDDNLVKSNGDYIRRNPHLLESKASELIEGVLNQVQPASQREVS